MINFDDKFREFKNTNKVDLTGMEQIDRELLCLYLSSIVKDKLMEIHRDKLQLAIEHSLNNWLKNFKYYTPIKSCDFEGNIYNFIDYLEIRYDFRNNALTQLNLKNDIDKFIKINNIDSTVQEFSCDVINSIISEGFLVSQHNESIVISRKIHGWEPKFIGKMTAKEYANRNVWKDKVIDKKLANNNELNKSDESDGLGCLIWGTILVFVVFCIAAVMLISAHSGCC